jgi:hypothetical protein
MLSLPLDASQSCIDIGPELPPLLLLRRGKASQPFGPVQRCQIHIRVNSSHNTFDCPPIFGLFLWNAKAPG